MQQPQLIRIRWAVRAALMLGVAASVAANVLHARPNLISQTISAWPPLALLLTVELTSRIPMHRKGLAALRVSATGVIAGIAAWVSYWHMQDVAVRYGETKMSAYLLPISVDGLIVVASVSLVELAGRIRFLEDSKAKPSATHTVEQALTTSALTDSLTPEMAANETSVAPVSPAVAFHPTSRPASGYSGGTGAPPGPNGGRGGARAAVATASRTMVTAAAKGESAAPRQRRPALETAELADAIEALNPDISQTELASQLGISVTRLKAVRREAEELRRANPAKRS